MLKIITVTELKPGMLVSKVVSQHGPVKIRKVGMIRGPEMIKGLAEMGVTEVEVDLAQSLGLSSDDVDTALDGDGTKEKEQPKLTPTQQLLKNERLTAKVNSEQSPHYNRSLFMPSLDNLPSMWTLYGKNITVLLLLVVGGLSVGWNIASIPQWLSLAKNKDYVVIDYQPNINTSSRVRDVNEADSVVDGVSDGTAGNISNRPGDKDDLSSQQEAANKASVTGESATRSNALSVNPKVNPNVNPNASENEVQSSQASAQQPLVLGYQPDNVSEVLAADRLAESQSSAQNNATDPAATAALLNKINQAIAELDNNSAQGDPLQQSSSYDDLPRIDQLSIALQTQIPSMSFSAHMYSSNRDGRWVRVNGRRLVEGDYIAEDLQLVNIEPQKVILMFKDEVFSMNALTDW